MLERRAGNTRRKGCPLHLLALYRPPSHLPQVPPLTAMFLEQRNLLLFISSTASMSGRMTCQHARFSTDSGPGGHCCRFSKLPGEELWLSAMPELLET